MKTNTPASTTIFEHAYVCDGSGEPGYRADVWIRGDKIVHIAKARPDASASPTGPATAPPPPADARRIDCGALVLAPGFIDVHTHDDAIVLDHPDMLPKISQGITTVVTGNCGISLFPVVTDTPPAPLSLLGRQQFRFDSFKDYARAVDQLAPATNVAALVGHTALRIQCVADLQRPATPAETGRMCALVEAAMQAGAFGLSSGIFYREAYAADMQEMVPLVRVVADHDGLYATHIRDEMRGILEALNEAADTARQAGAALLLSHHKCAGYANWGRVKETLPLIEQLALRQPIRMDVYPYTAGSTVLREDLVDGHIEILITGSEPHPEMIGQKLKDIAALWGISERDAMTRLKPGGACYFQMDQRDVDQVIGHPLSMIGSDGLPHDVHPHPRLWGAFPRLLDQYWRVKGVLKLEQAIYKMAGMAARQLSLTDRGEIRVGNFADLVLLDPARVRDIATYEKPNQFSEGIEQVWVNGGLSYTAGQTKAGARYGRYVRKG